MHVVIEPGVTFKQLQTELDNYNLRILPTVFSSFDSMGISNPQFGHRIRLQVLARTHRAQVDRP